ncbi:MAG: hypothetical protein IJ608_03110 [Lachnospiraceae bacterium]|nr:hypothetical protein [Lachnospiraceae bacterium]
MSEEKIAISLHAITGNEDKNMANGMRNTAGTQLNLGLTEMDRRDLVLDAVYRAKEFGQLIEMNDFMKEAIYGYNSNERKITRDIEHPRYISERSQERDTADGIHKHKVSKVRRITRDFDDFER